MIEAREDWPARAIVIREARRGGWSPVLYGTLVAADDPQRTPKPPVRLEAAMQAARLWQARTGFPVLMQEAWGVTRVMTGAEHRIWAQTHPRTERARYDR